MNLNKKLVAGVALAAFAIASSGSAFAEGRGGRHHSHGVSNDVKTAAGVILGAAIIGSLISASQPQPTYVPAPAYYYPPEHVAYSYQPPVVYRSAPTVVVESPRYYGHHHYHHHHGHGRRAGWEH